MNYLKKFLQIDSLLLIFILILFFYFRWPQYKNSINLEGQKTVQLIEIHDFRGEKISLQYPVALVFWASWCAPCEFELKRINRLIANESITTQQVIAISVDEDPKAAIDTAKKEGYKFQLAWDKTSNLSQQFSVRGTPSIIIIDKHQTIVWATTGISPLLEYKLLKLKDL